MKFHRIILEFLKILSMENNFLGIKLCEMIKKQFEKTKYSDFPKRSALFRYFDDVLNHFSDNSPQKIACKKVVEAMKIGKNDSIDMDKIKPVENFFTGKTKKLLWINIEDLAEMFNVLPQYKTFTNVESENKSLNSASSSALEVDFAFLKGNYYTFHKDNNRIQKQFARIRTSQPDEKGDFVMEYRSLYNYVSTFFEYHRPTLSIILHNKEYLFFLQLNVPYPDKEIYILMGNYSYHSTGFPDFETNAIIFLKTEDNFDDFFEKKVKNFPCDQIENELFDKNEIILAKYLKTLTQNDFHTAWISNIQTFEQIVMSKYPDIFEKKIAGIYEMYILVDKDSDSEAYLGLYFCEIKKDFTIEIKTMRQTSYLGKISVRNKGSILEGTASYQDSYISFVITISLEREYFWGAFVGIDTANSPMGGRICFVKSNSGNFEPTKFFIHQEEIQTAFQKHPFLLPFFLGKYDIYCETKLLLDTLEKRIS